MEHAMQAFVEKQTPTLASVLLHALLLLFLWTRVDVLPRGPERPQPIAMQIVVPPPDAGAGAAQPEPAPAMPEVQRTSPNPTEQPTPEIPAIVQAEEETEEDKMAKADEEKKDQLPPEPTPAPTTPSELKIAKTPLDQQILEQFRAQQQKAEEDLKARKSKIMTQVAGISAAEAPGVKRPYASAGSDRGAVRELDITRYPPDLQARFKARYDVKVEVKRVEGGSRQSYINAVLTDRGTYLNSGGSGVFEVMTLS